MALILWLFVPDKKDQEHAGAGLGHRRAAREEALGEHRLAPEQVRLTLSGVGGAFGGREELSMQIHNFSGQLQPVHLGPPHRVEVTRGLV